MDSEELLLDQAKRRKAAICPASCAYPAGCPDKAACPQAKTWVYRNFVKALPWYTSVREKLTNPAYAGFFLKFNPSNSTPYAVPPCDSNYSPPKCSPFYHDQEQTPGHPKGDGDEKTILIKAVRKYKQLISKRKYVAKLKAQGVSKLDARRGSSTSPTTSDAGSTASSSGGSSV